MASIGKLSIRGVRAFSPDDAEQVLEFYFPVTIIVGANGCGKTTIIESLKYAVSGSLPGGGAKAGQAFVHDPRSAGHSTVKANVKLRFQNRGGMEMVVVRAMEVNQAKTKLTFKQLDGVLRTRNADGKKQSMSHKCSELDKQIPFLLGVSKAILEHVIFCHQEDSSWPLMESQVLKKRFDDIFASSRYSKALEVFGKQKKEYAAKAKELKVLVHELGAHSFAASEYEREMAQRNQQLEVVENEIAAAQKEVTQIESDMAVVSKIMEELYQNDTQTQRLAFEKQEKNAICQSIRDMLQNDLTLNKSIDEIKQTLQSFEEEISKQNERKQELDDRSGELNKELREIQTERKKLEEVLTEKNAAQNLHQKNLVARYQKMVDIGTKYGLQDISTITQGSQTQPSQSQTNTSHMGGSYGDSSQVDGGGDATPKVEIPPEDMEKYFRVLQKKEDELKGEIAAEKRRRREQLEKIQTEITELSAKLKSIENDKGRVAKEMTEARRELQDISNKMPTVSRMRKADLEEAKQKAEKAKKDLETANGDPRKLEIQTEIRSFEEKNDKLSREIEDDHLALADLRHSAEAHNAISVLQEQCTKDLELLAENIRDESYRFQKFNVDIPASLPGSTGGDEDGLQLTTLVEGIVDVVSSKHESLSLELSKIADEKNALQRVISEKTALSTHSQQALDNKKPQLQELEGVHGPLKSVLGVLEAVKKFERSGNINTPALDESRPDELLEYLGNRLEEVESESIDINPKAIKKILKKLKNLAKESEKLSCPCCTREFETDDEFNAFVKSMKSLHKEESPLMQVDEESQEAIESYTEWKDIVTKNLPGIAEYRRLANEVDELEQNVNEMTAFLAQKNKELGDLESQYQSVQEDVQESRGLLEQTRQLAGSASRIAEKRMQVKQKQLDLSASAADYSGRDLKTVERELKEKIQAKDSNSTKISLLNKEMMQLNNRISQLTTTTQRLDNLAREKEERFSKEKEWTDKKKILGDNIAKLTEDEKQLQIQIAPIKSQLQTKETEKGRVVAMFDTEEERLDSNLNSFLVESLNLKEIAKDIDAYIESNQPAALAKVERDIKATSNRFKAKQKEIEALKPQLERMQKMVDDQENQKNNLAHNIRLITVQEEITKIDEEIETLMQKRAGIERADTIDGDMEALDDKKKSLVSSIARLDGRKGEIIEQIRGLKRKLKTAEYKNVDERHRIAMIKHETTQQAVKDIEKYYNALDKALIRFHSIKIAEINSIIRDLWNMTYKGEDITGIELVSGPEPGSKSTRSYNYRVQMTKGNTQLDMRGRCSAGQRVLASIVIRLALAETFCIQFGCIALDEPTVNLDHNNKRGLAIALAQIIASRSQQKNFQLVLITHDEDFVAMMKTELSGLTNFAMPEKYFQVRREATDDGKYYSKIDAIDWEELV